MDFVHRTLLAMVVVVETADAHAGSALHPRYSRLAQTAPPSAPPPPQLAAPSEAAPAENAALPETAPPIEGPRPGDRWVYELKDETAGEVKGNLTELVTEMTDKDIVLRVTSSRQPKPWTVAFNRDWSVTRENNGEIFTPNNCQGIASALKPGKEWHCSYRTWGSRAFAFWRGTVQAKVIDKENVTTEAGSFEAFRIAYAVKEGDPENVWVSVNSSIDMLYAPAINHWVKRRYRLYVRGRLQTDETMELTAYSQKP